MFKCVFNLYMLLPVLLTNFMHQGIARSMIFKTQNCANIVTNVTMILTTYFPPGSLVHIILSNDQSECLPASTMREFFNRWQIVISSYNDLTQTKNILPQSTDAYIIYINVFLNTYIGQLSHIMKSQLDLYPHSWNPEAKFLLITTTTTPLSKQTRNSLVIDTFNLMWQKNAFRTAMVLFDQTKETIISFSGVPFSKQYGTCREIISTRQLQTIDLNNKDILSIPGYSFETPRDFLGCPLTAETYDVPPYSVQKVYNSTGFYRAHSSGTEFELVSLFANMYNISLKIKNPKEADFKQWLHIDPNSSTIGMLKDIINYKVDLAFAGAIPYHKYFLLGHIFTNDFTALNWFVPLHNKTSQWQVIANIFTSFTWFLQALLFIFFTLAYYSLGRFIVRVDEYMEFREPVSLTMLRSLLGNPTTCPPKMNHVRIMLITWYLYSLHMTNVYNSQLFSCLTNDPVYPAVISLKGLYESQLKTCTSSFYHDLYTNMNDSYARKVLENSMICEEIDIAVENFMKYSDLSVLVEDDTMGFLVKNGTQALKLRENFFTYPISIYVTKGSILIKPLGSLNLNVTESGLMQHWRHNVPNEVKIKYASKEILSNLTHDIMHIEDLVWLFLILLNANGVAFSVFVMELCYSYCKTFLNKKSSKSRLCHTRLKHNNIKIKCGFSNSSKI